MKLSFLEYRGSIEILYSLYENREMYLTDLLWKLKKEARMGQSTFYRTLGVLLDEGIVKERKNLPASRARILSLSNKGLKVVEYLKKLEEELH